MTSCQGAKYMPASVEPLPSGHSARGNSTPGAAICKRNIATFAAIKAVVTGGMFPTWGRLESNQSKAGAIGSLDTINSSNHIYASGCSSSGSLLVMYGSSQIFPYFMNGFSGARKLRS